MHNLALALHEKGEEVTGSDDEIFEPSKSRLEAKGLLPSEYGWFPEKISSSIDAIILGMHAKADNPELIKARQLGLKIYSYPEYLYEHSKSKTRVVIGGSHGKTTITAMVLHVMHYHEKQVDYMVGAQLEGFETMVHLTEDNDFIILEGDEYLSSAIDLRPKFHLYKPNIALLSGISWDHINVFPTFEKYVEQFELFLETMTHGSTLVYNEEDDILSKIAQNAIKPTRKHAYSTPEHNINNGVTYLQTAEGPMPIEVFGKHNLQNIAGAKWICQHMGVDEDDFYEAIASFTGASKRLEKIAESDRAVVFKDYAHSPSKVLATSTAVKTQFYSKIVVACLELHTYSSLNTEFLNEYKESLNAADEAVVFYIPKTLEIKKLEMISKEQILEAFGRKNLKVFTEPEDFKNFLKSIQYIDHVLLLMSSGNYGGLNFDEVKEWIQ